MNCMKRITLAILVTILLTCSLGSLSEKEITFRNLDWHSMKDVVEGALLTDGARRQGTIDSDSFASVRMTRDSQDLLSINYFDDYGFRDYYEGIKVAGYTVDFLSTYYLFPLKDDQILKDKNLAEFYLGVYSLTLPESSTNKEMYNDLSLKLSYIYGEYLTVDVPELFGDDSQARMWSDLKDNLIILSFPDTTAMLLYYAGDASSHIDNLLYHSPDSLEGL